MPNPDRLDFIRRRLGMTKTAFADLLGVNRKIIQRFEAGTINIPEECLEKLSVHSGYPKSFFYKTSSPEYPSSDGVSFRSLRSLTASNRDGATAAAAIAFELDDWINGRYELPEANLIHTNGAIPEKAAALLRAAWGIGERPISNMINLLEVHGVRVFSLVEETRHLDAYSLWRNEKPYIFLNTLKTAEHSRFDAAHELGHLVMHRHSGSTHPKAETEANAFASAFLMPINDLKAEFPWVRSLNDLIEKKKRWGVSVSALNYALHKAGSISEWHYKSHYIALAKLGRANEPNPLPPETSQVWAKILKDLWIQNITLTHIAAELGVAERELNNLLFGIAINQKQKPTSAPLKLI